MAKAKLVKWEKVVRNGVHNTYEKNNKTYWNFSVEFDNGDKGTVSKESDSGKGLENGKEYTYDIKANEKYPQYFNITKMLDANAPAFVPGGGYKEDPNAQLHSMRLTALEQGMIIENSLGDKNEVIVAIESFLIDRAKTNKSMVVQGCLKRAVQAHEIEPFKSIVELLAKADQFLIWVTRA